MILPRIKYAVAATVESREIVRSLLSVTYKLF
jgi:hypothetical protein